MRIGPSADAIEVHEPLARSEESLWISSDRVFGDESVRMTPDPTHTEWVRVQFLTAAPKSVFDADVEHGKTIAELAAEQRAFLALHSDEEFEDDAVELPELG